MSDEIARHGGDHMTYQTAQNAGKSLVGYVMQEQDEQKQKDSADSLRCRIGVLGRRQV
ncbi:MAG: hypothetical protein O2856_01065 [Planctomycetota bacterium]|nr:hypothetical protein [Planctomycetota bacterium]